MKRIWTLTAISTLLLGFSGPASADPPWKGKPGKGPPHHRHDDKWQEKRWKEIEKARAKQHKEAEKRWEHERKEQEKYWKEREKWREHRFDDRGYDHRNRPPAYQYPERPWYDDHDYHPPYRSYRQYDAMPEYAPPPEAYHRAVPYRTDDAYDRYDDDFGRGADVGARIGARIGGAIGGPEGAAIGADIGRDIGIEVDRR